MNDDLIDEKIMQSYSISDYNHENLFFAVCIAIYLVVSVGLILLAISLKAIIAYVLFGLFVIDNLFIVYILTTKIILNVKKIRKLRRESKMNTNKY